MEEPVLPLSLIALSVFPLVDTVTRGLILVVLPREDASIGIGSLALSMPFTVLEFSNVDIAVRPYQSSLTVRYLGPDITLIA